ncbi:MAG: peptidase domain protein, partial [Deltaproteobacteria bacterium]|nr:peptidase domain protein [Deltaproteobacteria bacterium]
TPKEEGLFIVLVTFKGDDYQAVVRAIDEQIKKMYTGPVDKWELEKAKNLVRASHIYASETVQGRAREIGSYQTITDDARFSDKYVKQVDSVSVPIIKQALKQYMVDKERNIALLAPKAKQNPHTFQLKNGLTCVLNRNAASPSFAFMIGFVGGLKEERESQNGSFNLLSKMLLRGTSDKDAQAIARQIDTLAGSIDPVSGKNVFGLSGKFLSKDLKQSLSLLNELLSDSTIPRRELTKVKEDVLSEIRQKEDDAVSSTFKAMNRALYEGHPYGRDALGNATDVARLTHKEIAALYKDCVSPKGAVLALSGDIDLKETERLVRSIFGAWKGKARSLRKLPHVATKKEKTIRREMLQTHMIFAFSGPGLIEEDRYAAEVMDSVLSGMGGRIHKRLREERPYAYALTFFNQMAYETGALGIYIGTEQKHVRDIEDVVGKEIGEIRKEGFSEEEVTNAKRYLVGTHRIRMQSNSAIASSMCLDTMYGLKPDFFKRWPERIEKVTRDEVNAAAKKYLLPEKMVEITVGPGDKK